MQPRAGKLNSLTYWVSSLSQSQELPQGCLRVKYDHVGTRVLQSHWHWIPPIPPTQG